MARFYVNMRDSFMSGWGKALGRSYYCVGCDTIEQARAIERAALMRGEMRNVAISDRPRRARAAGDHVSVKHVSELGGPWLHYMPDSEMPKKRESI